MKIWCWLHETFFHFSTSKKHRNKNNTLVFRSLLHVFLFASLWHFGYTYTYVIWIITFVSLLVAMWNHYLHACCDLIGCHDVRHAVSVLATNAGVPLLQEVAFYSETRNGSSFMVWFDDDESSQTVDHMKFVSTQTCAKSIYSWKKCDLLSFACTCTCTCTYFI